MKIFKLSILTGMLSLLSLMGYGQQGGMSKSVSQIKHLELRLSPQQILGLDSINNELQSTIILLPQSLLPEQRKQLIDQAIVKQQLRLKTLLTKDQYELLLRVTEENSNFYKRRMEKNRPASLNKNSQ